MSSPEPGCRFCLANSLINDEPLFQNETSYFLASADPVLPHGGMIIPFRHLTTPFDMDAKEWLGTRDMLAQAKALLMPSAPDGFTIGWNVGTVAGQTVSHVHLHIIGRFSDEPLAGQGLRHHIKQPANRRPRRQI